MIDWTKPVQTRGGRKVTIYCTNAPGMYPTHGRVEGQDFPVAWLANERVNHETESSGDLINVPPKIDFTKPIQTRDGRKWTKYCTDAPGRYPVHGYIEGEERPDAWKLDGSLYAYPGSPGDLVNVPPKMVKVDCWINIYRYHVQAHATKSLADDSAGDDRLACIHVIALVEEGTFE